MSGLLGLRWEKTFSPGNLLLEQVQDTLTSVRHQPLSTTLWQLGGPLAIALVVLLISQAAARLFGASRVSPAALSSLGPEQYSTVLQENRELWQQLNETRMLLEQGDFRWGPHIT